MWWHKAQKPYFIFWWNRRVHLNRRGHQFGQLLAAEVCASVVVMLDTPCSEVVWRVLATHFIRQFPLHFPYPCITVCYHISTGVYQSGLHKCLYWTVLPVVDRSVSLNCVSGLVQSVLGVSSTSYWETLLALVSLISPPSQQAKLKLCTGYGKCIATVTHAVLEREGRQRILYPPHLPGDHMENLDSQHGSTLSPPTGLFLNTS
jgi:hypothetical protein